MDAALAHELADCLWRVLTIADAVGIDMEHAFTATMQELNAWLSARSRRRLSDSPPNPALAVCCPDGDFVPRS